MAEIAVADIRSSYDVATVISDSRIEFCIGNAQRKVKKVIGSDQYDRAFDSPVASGDEELAADVTEATIKLSMAEILINANLRIRASGQVIKEQDAGSPGMSTSNQVENQYLTPEQVDSWRDRLVNDAMDLLREYSLTGQVQGMGTLRIGASY